MTPVARFGDHVEVDPSAYGWPGVRCKECGAAAIGGCSYRRVELKHKDGCSHGPVEVQLAWREVYGL